MGATYSEKLAKKFPVKYGRDHHEQKLLGDMVDEFIAMMKTEPSRERCCDHLDREFFFGTWGDYCKDTPHLFLADVRGFIISLYKKMEDVK